ncbi:MAG: hypothetical protein U5N85_01715 [Arcicella sp.]|nr:hypothetical protein [Arcicella sp.]
MNDSIFDNEFYVKSSHKEKAICLLNSDELQKIYFSATKNLDLMVSIEIKGDNFFTHSSSYPPNAWFVVIKADTIINDIERLVSWFNLCKITLDRLIEIGEAEDITPEIQ